MGRVKHHAIIVTGTYGEWPEKAHAEASRHGGSLVTPLSQGVVNDTRSFAILPDGSNEGWPESHAGDAFRNGFIAWLEDQRYEDGSSPLAWVEVQFKECEPAVMRHSGAPVGSEANPAAATSTDTEDFTPADPTQTELMQ